MGSPASGPLVAVFACDGRDWIAGICAPAGSGRTVTESVCFPADGAGAIPESALAWAAERKARQACVLVPCDPASLALQLPDGLAAEERHAAIAWELAEVSPLAADAMRVAACQASPLGMGARENAVLAAGFSTGQIDSYAQACRLHRISLRGVGSLQLAALVAHSRLGGVDTGLLLLLSDSGFIAIPGRDRKPLTVRSIPVGLGQLGRPDSCDERMARRFSGLAEQPVCVVLGQGAAAGLMDALPKLLGTAQVQARSLEEIMGSLMELAAAGEAGDPASPFPLAGLPAPSKDPHRWGTAAAVAALVAALSYIGFQAHGLRQEQVHLEQAVREYLQVKAARDRADERLKELERNISDRQKILRLLEKPHRIQSNMLRILTMLPEIKPERTWLTAVREDNQEVVIEGLTDSQADLADLGSRLEQGVSEFSMTVIPQETMPAGELSPSGRSAQRFTVRIVPR